MQLDETPKLAALYGALAAAQGEFPPIPKNRNVKIHTKARDGREAGSYQFRYADLEIILEKTAPARAKNGLAITSIVRGNVIRTVLAHSGGGTIESVIELPEAGSDLKALGAAITYLRRYAVSALLGVSADDDLDEDGGEGDKGGKTLSQWEASDDHAEGNAQRKAPVAAGTNKPATEGERNWLKNNAGDQMLAMLKSVNCDKLDDLTNAQFILLRGKLKNAA